MSESETDDASSTMGFSGEKTNKLMEEISDTLKDILGAVKCKKVSDLQLDMFKKPNKDKLAEWMVSMCNTLEMSRSLFLGASAHIDELQRDVIDNQKITIKLQEDIIHCKDFQISGVQQAVESEMNGLKTVVQDTFKAEIKSYSAAVESSTSSSLVIPSGKLQSVAKTIVEEEDRSKHVMVFGLPESSTEPLADVATEIFQELGEKPKVVSVCRLGSVKPGIVRPVKVALRSHSDCSQVLWKSRNLRMVDKYKNVFLAPDRSPDEREKHKELVNKLKEKRLKEPQKRHYIRSGNICSVDNDKCDTDSTADYFRILCNMEV